MWPSFEYPHTEYRNPAGPGTIVREGVFFSVLALLTREIEEMIAMLDRQVVFFGAERARVLRRKHNKP